MEGGLQSVTNRQTHKGLRERPKTEKNEKRVKEKETLIKGESCTKGNSNHFCCYCPQRSHFHDLKD